MIEERGLGVVDVALINEWLRTQTILWKIAKEFSGIATYCAQRERCQVFWGISSVNFSLRFPKKKS
jgi:hypothetical protein